MACKNKYVGRFIVGREVHTGMYCCAYSEKQAYGIFVKRIAKKQGVLPVDVFTWLKRNPGHSEVELVMEYKEVDTIEFIEMEGWKLDNTLARINLGQSIGLSYDEARALLEYMRKYGEPLVRTTAAGAETYTWFEGIRIIEGCRLLITIIDTDKLEVAQDILLYLRAIRRLTQ